ncbi:hypothetical protein EMCG_06502 [[Emmonsia] crescens]|uniref:Xylanolytic transcriptional activator regulatory domain-containing protein n=1 Tax=[Emmonsia] crescens TaxID=73230 RepID=A0A0G2IAX7_9EURO|nr:hypothetical protein EMCG_06502 [Emmonsia crescens UAMH 3008]
MENVMNAEICVIRDSNVAVINLDKLPGTVEVTVAEADAYIEAYFENLHPLYPFLDRQEFASHVLELRSQDTKDTSKALSALYHAVLTLGNQYHNSGSFLPGSGKSWDLFQICLGHLPDLIVPAYSLVKLQALTAMSIFAMNMSCIKLDQTLIYEAARVAQYLRYHKSCNAQESHLRLFWTIYYIEKMTAFYESNSSVIADEDIGCVVPAVPESTIAGYDWFLSATRLGRLCSMTYTSLFSTEATLKNKTSLLASIKRIQNRLEQWRLSVPMAYRPKEALQLSKFERPSTKWIVIQTHYLYYNLVIAVERLSLHIYSEDDPDTNDSQRNLRDAAQSVAELVPFIDLAPHVPIFVSGIMPMSALFVLFDLVIRFPRHNETNKNLVLLDQAAEYFTRLEMASKGVIPGRNIAEFATLARHYIRKIEFDGAGLKGTYQCDLSIPNLVQGSEQLGQWIPDIELEYLCASSADNMGSFSGSHLPSIENSVTPPMELTSSLDPLEKSEESECSIGTHPAFDFLFPGWTLDDTTIAELHDAAATSEYDL